MSKCIILNYHAIIDCQSNDSAYDPIYAIQKEVFVSHLKLIRDSGISVVPIHHLDVLKFSNERYLSITFDDGHSSDYTTVLPLLELFGLKASFFVTLKNAPSDSGRWQQYQQMAAQGHYIGMHGVSHNYLTDLCKIDQINELEGSKVFIEKIIGTQDHYFSLPGGKYNQNLIEVAKNLGYKALLTTDFGVCETAQDQFLMKRCSIKRNMSSTAFRNLIEFNHCYIQKEVLISRMKKCMQQIIGNRMADKINYAVRS